MKINLSLALLQIILVSVSIKLSFINIHIYTHIYLILLIYQLYYFIILASHDLQRYIIRKILDIGYQLNSLTEQGNIINNKLDTIIQNLQISSSHGIESEILEQDIMNKFPIENIEDLQNFEKSLIAGQINRQKLVSAKI